MISPPRSGPPTFTGSAVQRKRFAVSQPYERRTAIPDSPSATVSNHATAVASEPVSLGSLQKKLREMRSEIRESLGEIKTTLRDLEGKVERSFKDFEKKMPERAESQVQGQLMREVKVVMTRVHQSIARITGDALSPEYIKIQSMLPITSQDAINTLEELLNTKSYSEAMLNILLKLRGAKGCIKGVMKRVYSDCLMFHYNFEGKANKSALLGLKSLELIFDTFNSTPKSEVIAEIRKAVLMSHNRHKQVVRKQKQKINIQNNN
ncbi:uncharacterized protein LOC128860920 isoform X2 [Anastrepha ludens]|uniref:uncharacterized protein LOC128860920 isoform X2 n=1 Tax=Anastrepha ludens TaxID=28586 RepID=UPI0023B1B60F|nr:uncharacterized protein LOC128860920 isoform X2 [Anastrepha ludens]